MLDIKKTFIVSMPLYQLHVIGLWKIECIIMFELEKDAQVSYMMSYISIS